LIGRYNKERKVSEDENNEEERSESSPTITKSVKVTKGKKSK